MDKTSMNFKINNAVWSKLGGETIIVSGPCCCGERVVFYYSDFDNQHHAEKKCSRCENVMDATATILP